MSCHRLVLFVQTLVTALALVSCAQFDSSQEPRGSRLGGILERGELRIGTSGDLPPLNMIDRDGRVTGFEAELMRALADAMDLEPRFVVAPFADLLNELEAGEVDVVVAGMTMTPERNLRVAFAGPYLISGVALLTRDEELAQATEPAQLDDETLSYAALSTSTSGRYVSQELPRAQLVETRDYESAVAKLLAGEVDAVMADFFACKLALWRHPDAGLLMARTLFTTEPIGVALPADDPLLLNLVENYLSTLGDTGELMMHKADWLADGHWLERLP